MSQHSHNKRTVGARGRTRTSEGTHFQESRRGGRISAADGNGLRRLRSKKVVSDANEAPKSTCQADVHARKKPDDLSLTVMNAAGGTDEYQTSVVSRAQRRTSASPSDRKIRKSNSMHNGMCPDDVSHSHGTMEIRNVHTALPVKTKTQGLLWDDTAKAIAGDAHLQDFHKRSLRKRSSFMEPFKLRFPRSSANPLESIKHDSSVPPFNLADDGDDVFVASLLSIQNDPSEHAQRVLPVRKQRISSDTLKGRLGRIIGIKKRSQTAFPTQHVVAKQPHLGIATANSGSDSQRVPIPDRPPPPPPFFSSSTTNSQSRTSSAITAGAADESQNGRSRVTSWTNSTVGGTVGAHSQQKRLTSIDEAKIVTKDSTTSRRGSLLARTLRFPSRSRSRADLNRSSEDSQRLYDALRKQIEVDQPQDRDSTEIVINGSPVPQDPMTDKFRMSFVPKTVNEAEESPASRGTIRTVTPDDCNHVSKVPHLVPQAETGRIPNASPHESESGHTNSATNCSGVGPSAEARVSERDRLARRQERAKNRWQSALEQESPVLSRAMLYGSNDNPYELPSLRYQQHEYIPTAIHHDRADRKSAGPRLERQNSKEMREHVISPSIYSQTADSYSPRHAVSKEARGTIVTITGREVKSYSLNTPKQDVTTSGH